MKKCANCKSSALEGTEEGLQCLSCSLLYQIGDDGVMHVSGEELERIAALFIEASSREDAADISA